MTHDRFSQFPTSRPDAEPRHRPFVTRGLMLAGVAAAGLMGVGLGLWARPAMSERRMAAAAEVHTPAAQPAREPRRQLQIVVDDSPAPIGAPIEVLPAGMDEPARRIDRDVEPEPLAPVRPPQGLTRVVAAMPAHAEPAVAAPKPVVKRVIAAPRPEKLQVAKARSVHGKTGVQLAKAKAKAKATPPVVLATAAPAKPAGKLSRMLVRLVPHKAKAEAEARLEKVKFERHAKAGSRKATSDERASRKSRADRKPAKIERVVAHKAKPAPRREAPAPPMRPSGLMKVANRSRCGQSDPGAALVCADPTLGAADRQLNRAYNEARAAGVSDAQLARQQQRWLSARSAAAREAPWAVHDVYLARIAELNGLAREAGGGN